MGPQGPLPRLPVVQRNMRHDHLHLTDAVLAIFITDLPKVWQADRGLFDKKVTAALVFEHESRRPSEAGPRAA